MQGLSRNPLKTLENTRQGLLKTLVAHLVLAGLLFGSAVAYSPDLVAATKESAMSLSSPSGELEILVEHDQHLSWSVAYKGQVILQPGKLDLLVNEGQSLLAGAKLLEAKRRDVQSSVTPVLKQKNAHVDERFRELSLDFDSDLGLQFRAYDDGVAYRFILKGEGDVLVQNEQLELNFKNTATSLFPEEESLISHNERLYLAENVAEIAPPRFASLPVYFKSNGVHLVFSEADLFDYPAMFLYAGEGATMKAGFPGFVTKATPTPGSEDRNEIVEMADYIAVTHKGRTLPWRVAVISDDARDLPASELVFLLARENQISDTSWIKPGRVAWDWYNANNLFGVDFKAGLNTQTYKHYIDFASKYGIEYVILDEGWTLTTTNTKAHNPDIDVHELIAYGKKKNVDIILWTLWKPLDKDYKNILAMYAKWGAAGIKVDFMQRSDQYMVNYYEKIAKEAAKHKLLVDFHGAFKPTGLGRTWPNVVSYEGVKGNENNKWSQDISPEHNVTLPFIRMVAGPMDFTPGAMTNAHKGNHHISHFRPMSLGTRTHQVAMYAVFESPLQMYCDSPSLYQREPELTQFMTRFPSIWDETRILAGEVGDYILVARRSGKTWYLGAMTDWSARELEVDLSFLGRGKYTMTYVEDGPNAETHAQDYAIHKTRVTKKTKMPIRLASGGGWAAIIEK